jgi:hypothetical protein
LTVGQLVCGVAVGTQLPPVVSARNISVAVTGLASRHASVAIYFVCCDQFKFQQSFSGVARFV